MVGELIAIIGSTAAVGIGLAVLIVRSIARLDRRIDRLEDSLGRRIDGAEDSLGRRIDGAEDSFGRRIDGVEKGQAELRERMAKLEGLLEGLREAISGRRAA